MDRHDDYEPGSPFRSVFTKEIVPLIETRYHIAPGRRALLGLSRSTVGALDTCANSSIVFESCVLLAPAIPPAQFERVLPSASSPTRVLIETGSYDIPLVSDARALRHVLESRLLAVRYVETPEGHNHTAFRARLPSIMEQLFPPPRSSERPK